MNRYTITQVIGMALLVLSGQGAVRLLVDPTDSGLLGWLPGGFAASLGGHLLLALAGATVAVWGRRRSALDHRS